MKKNVKQRKEWIYSERVKRHFFHPKNLLLKEPKKGEFDAVGIMGNPACGDVMKMWIKVEPKTQRIKKLKWRTFGCASAIASTSVFSKMVTEGGSALTRRGRPRRGGGMKLKEALKITPQDIIKRLGGLPPYKIHCSVLADSAFRKTVENYLKKL